MALTAMRAGDSEILHAHPNLNFQTGAYHYNITTRGSDVIYTMTSLGQTFTAPLTWAFGTNRVGQSYLIETKDDGFHEAKVTYFPSLQNLHFTPFRAFTVAKDMEEAMIRKVPSTEVRRCFSCHATAPIVDNALEEKGLFLGVTCEACHSPGAKHVALMQSAALEGISISGPRQIFNPGSFGPTDSVEFCGACHGTWWDVKLSGAKGISNSRVQPYRLVMSKCWGKGDARLTCMKCHDPHKEVSHDAESYDHVCLSCHVSSAGLKPTFDHPGKPCPQATKACTSCHMPKVDIPEMHFFFTDHKIRISQPGEAYEE